MKVTDFIKNESDIKNTLEILYAIITLRPWEAKPRIEMVKMLFDELRTSDILYDYSEYYHKFVCLILTDPHICWRSSVANYCTDILSNIAWKKE